jgi:hypothetical protein
VKYKQIENKLVQIDSFIRECGLFTSDTNLNNGYGCKSKSKSKQEPGCCYTYDCPLAHEADKEDLKELDHDLYLSYSEDENIEGSGWMVQHSEVKRVTMTVIKGRE